MVNVNSTQSSFRITLDLYEKLREQAYKQNRSQGEIINEALEDYFKKIENQTKLEINEWMWCWMKNLEKKHNQGSEKDTRNILITKVIT